MASRSGALFTDIGLFHAFASRKHTSTSNSSPVSSCSPSDEGQMMKRMGSDGSVGRKAHGGLDLFGWRTQRSESHEELNTSSTHLAPLTGCACFDESRLGASAPEFDQVFSSAPLFDDEDMAPSAPELTPTSLYGCYCLERMPSAPSFEDEDDQDMEGDDGGLEAGEFGIFVMDD